MKIEKHLKELKNAISINSKLTKAIAQNAASKQQENQHEHSHGQIDKVKTTLRQFVREWTLDGTQEREQAFTPIISSLLKIFPILEHRKNIRILIPGAGLCRLPVELSIHGFKVEANEISSHMLVATQWMFDNAKKLERNEKFFFPWIHNTTNLIERQASQLKQMEFEFEMVKKIPNDGSLSVSVGDFVEIYSENERKETFDVIVTCFFIDTAQNVEKYLETIQNCLKKGGIWINIGPLSWHWVGTKDLSIELTLNEIIEISKSNFGFQMIGELKYLPCNYNQSKESLLEVIYNCAVFEMRKM